MHSRAGFFALLFKIKVHYFRHYPTDGVPVVRLSSYNPELAAQDARAVTPEPQWQPAGPGGFQGPACARQELTCAGN